MSLSTRNALRSRAERPSIKLALILGIFVLPVVSSYLVYYFWRPAGASNYGELLQAFPLPDPALKLSDGNRFRLSGLRGRWILLQVDSGACAGNCGQKLRDMRQIRLALGKDAERVERVYLMDDGKTPSAAIKTEYAGTWFIQAAGSTLVQGLPAARSCRDHIYVADPRGNLILRYPMDPDARRMARDMKRLLSVSRIG